MRREARRTSRARSLVVFKAAIISDCGLFRYSLTRIWNHDLPLLVWILLNPSVADAMLDDQTVLKGMGFTARLGFGGMVFLNLYAYRATKPVALKLAGYPIGAANDEHIDEWLRKAGGGFVLCGWGANARGLARPAEVLRLVRAAGLHPMALHLTKDGIPGHPLMLAYDLAAHPLLEVA